MEFGTGYDAVISTSALHHFTEEDKVRLYRKALECLKPGGIFINSDKCVETQAEQDHAFKEFEEDPNKYRHMDTPLTPENECKVMRAAGFAKVSAEPIEDSNYFLMIGFRQQ